MKQLLIVFTLGAFAALSMAPANFWPALFVGLSGFYLILAQAKSKHTAALTGFSFSLGYFGFSLYWIGNALLVEDNPYWWAWPLAVSGLPIILSIFTALACTFYHIMCKNKSTLGTAAIFSIILASSEFARGHLFTGFPWNLFGYTWISIPQIAQIAALHNIYVLNTITIFWALAPAIICYETRKSKKFFTIATAILSFAACYTYGLKKIASKTAQKTETEIVLIQPNIPQNEKWDGEKRVQHFMDLTELSRYKVSDAKSHIIIWPETAIAQDILDAPWAMNIIREMLQTYPDEAYLVTGALLKQDSKYYNSILVMNKNADIIDIYHKSHLVPFGEYMPLSNIFDISPIVGFSGFDAGAGPQTIQISDNIKFSPLVCYEIIFPGKSISAENKKPDFIINVTNDGWYGNSPGPYQHLVQAQFRAIETGIPVFRSANTGISAAISPTGEITQHIELQKKGRMIQTIYKNIENSNLK